MTTNGRYVSSHYLPYLMLLQLTSYFFIVKNKVELGFVLNEKNKMDTMNELSEFFYC